MTEPRRYSPHELRQRGERLWRNLSRDPLVARARQEVNSELRRGEVRRANGIEPWHVLAEQRAAALLMLRAIDDNSIVLHIGETADRLLACVSVADTLIRAEPYLWTSEIMKTAHAAPLPKHVVGPGLLAHPSMYFSTELARPELPNERYENNWTLITTAISDTRSSDRPIMIVRDRWDQTAMRMEIHFDALRFGDIYPDDFQGDRLFFAQQILAELAFMNSPYVTASRSRLPRPVRKEINREAKREGRLPSSEPVVNVVELRREVREQIALATEIREQGERGEREWQHHWWVSGHYRAQWMPSTESHKVIWIAPYLKGPMDKPLLDRRVYIVDR